IYLPFKLPEQCLENQRLLYLRVAIMVVYLSSEQRPVLLMHHMILLSLLITIGKGLARYLKAIRLILLVSLLKRTRVLVVVFLVVQNFYKNLIFGQKKIKLFLSWMRS